MPRSKTFIRMIVICLFQMLKQYTVIASSNNMKEANEENKMFCFQKIWYENIVGCRSKWRIANVNIIRMFSILSGIKVYREDSRRIILNGLCSFEFEALGIILKRILCTN